MRSSTSFYLSRLDHLRFYAAALVVLFHYFVRFVPNTAFQNPLGSLLNEGHVGIGLFMVISGFIFSVLTGNREVSYSGFVFNRFVRIYPLYTFAVVLAVTMMVYQKMQTNLGIFDILAWLFFFRPPTIVEIPHFVHLWTIPVEFSFYLLFPFLHTFFLRYGARYFLGLIALLLLVRAGIYVEYGTVRYVAYETLFGRLDQFLIGYMAGWLYANGRGRAFWASPLTLAGSVVVMLAAVNWLNRQGGSLNMDAAWWVFWPDVEGLVWAAVVLAYMHCRWQWPAWLDTPLARLGELSFALYVAHLFVVIVIANTLGLPSLTASTPLNAALTGLLVALPCSLAVAVLLHQLIEKPFLLYRKVYMRRTAPVAAGRKRLGRRE